MNANKAPYKNPFLYKTPIITYSDVVSCKPAIYSMNRGKSGVYCWRNKISNKAYVGSGLDLTRRLNDYLKPRYLKKELLSKNSKIYGSLLKYGYSNFSLDILEYCEQPDLLIEREQYYIDLLNPEYNICKVAGSRSGCKHSPETLLKLKNRKLSPQALINLKLAKTGKAPTSPLRVINHLLATGHKTILINKKDNSIKQYPSIRSAAKDINATHGSLIYCMENNLLFKNTYLIIKLIKIKY
uniref:GIY-YIG endonuclease n=4 Tax=Fusarium TaxID=5506 RepID=A0A2C8D383_FUSOX|nr:GIY-YIG endonuclease [Fusarium ramigenum]SNU76836.1 TPA: GIY-YIG endonuclease [Fusarium oxysporum f. sp. lycopersici]SNU77060.1 TPA: GIY-YIG endonuclease [Fusarium oxysporum f. sp. cucumerinum]SNU77837.1 TPA: GIY-YIG endonuclease [Fusarium oxysporum]SNU76885.1 TPA: GIY-YIG endonuclease [Fusarium oxysporum f. sp. lycopersici]